MRSTQPPGTARLRLPAPGVQFDSGFTRRIGAFAVRLSAAREREDVGRRRALQGNGEEFVGHRPYRLGDDLRHLDWSLLARGQGPPFVRVHRANASECWFVAIDTSASMGIGSPGKLQSAAEAAAACMVLGLRLGARVTLARPASQGGGVVEMRRPADIHRAMALLEAMEASVDGADSWASCALDGGAMGWESASAAALVRSSRALFFGDLLDVDPPSLAALSRNGRRVHLGQVFSAEEWDPDSAGGEGVRWVDPEAPREAVPASLGGTDRYRARLDAFVARWAETARNHRMSHAVWRSQEPFEDHVPRLLR